MKTPAERSVAGWRSTAIAIPVPVDWIGRRVEVRETKDKIKIQLDARRLVTHRRIAEAEHQRVMLAEHLPRLSPHTIHS